MTIKDIYSKYSIPLNLQQHMLRVASVGKCIIDNWVDNSLDSDLIIKTLLLHDMGNIIKFKFDNPNLLIPEDRSRIIELKQIRKKFITKYGQNCDTATLQIINEITNDQNIVNLCWHSHGEELLDILNESNWERKICFYSDMRVGPFGIMSLDDRYDDLTKRYSKDIKYIENNRQLTHNLENQIQAKVFVNLNSINDQLIFPNIEDLTSFSQF